MTKALNVAKLAEQFDQLAELMLAISGTFRGGASDSDEAAGDAKPSRKVRAAAPADDEPAEKPARRSRKPAVVEEDTEDTHTEDQVRAALKELASVKGKDAMAEALASVGAGRLPDVDENDYGVLMKAVKEAMEAEEEEEKPAVKSKAKPKAKAKEVDFDDVKEKFTQLVETDKAAAKKVLKAAGVAKLSEVDTDDAEAVAELAKAIDEALENADDDLVG
jgi:hypothetical protein